MTIKGSLVFYLLQLIGKFLLYSFRVVALSVVLGVTASLLMCSWRGICVTGTFSWFIVIMFLITLGFIIGTFKFFKLES